MTSVEVRIATPDDAEAVGAIYAPYIETTAISFERVVPSVAEMRQRICERLPTYPWLVAEIESQVVGYAYASRFAPRAAYDWSVESSVYVSADYKRRGIGRTLYDHLIPVLKLQQFRMVYAGIAMPNEASVFLHERLGFSKVANFENAGFKFGSWHDVGWWTMDLQPELATIDDPPRPTPFAEFVADGRWSDLFGK